MTTVEARKRKLPSDDICEDGEILSDDENQSKIVKTDSEKQSESHNLNIDKTLENSQIINENHNNNNNSSKIEEIDKNETIDGFVVIEDSEDKTIIVDNLLVKEKNLCCSQATETTDSGIGSQSLDIDQHIQQLDETNPINEETLIESPCITIRFKDSRICDQYKVKFLKFLNNFVELQAKYTDNLNIEIYQDCNFDPNEWVVVDETLHDTLIDDEVYCSPKRHRNRKSKAKKELFVLDANPTTSTSTTTHKNGHDLRYTSKFVINSDTKKLEEKSSNLKCFNCGDDHLLKDCTQPKDSRRINNARDKLKQPQKPTRYHVEPDEKLSQLAPGKFSNELRTALALRRNELPPFIYKMRKFGYPPGWLEEARIVYSDLNLFDIDGKNLKTNGRKSGGGGGIDPTKIIDYPGFNVPLDKDYRDEWKFYGVPPYSDVFSKESMINYIDEQLKRNNDNLETVDMDLDDGDVTMITLNDNCTINNELSLNELEQQKLELLNELNEEQSTINHQNNDESEQMINSIVKSTCYGTPIIKNKSPYMKLPNPDNFSKDISPVINFENLPNSTGKYEQMVDVLQKVRKTLKEQQQQHSCST